MTSYLDMGHKLLFWNFQANFVRHHFQAKVEISQDTKSLEIERSERDKREKEAIEAVKKFEIKQREVHDCIELKDEVHQKYLVSFYSLIALSANKIGAPRPFANQRMT